MAGSSSILEDGSALSRLDRGLYRVETVLALARRTGGVFADAAGGGQRRRAEFLQPAAARLCRLDRAGDAADRVPRASPIASGWAGISGWISWWVSCAGGPCGWRSSSPPCFMLVLMVLLVWGSFSHFLRSFDFAAPLWSRDSSFDIRLPLWPAKLIVPVAFSVMCLRLVLQLWGYARAIATGADAARGGAADRGCGGGGRAGGRPCLGL